MSWKITALQSIILIVLTYLAIQYFSLDLLGNLKFQQEEMSVEVSSLAEKVAHLEQEMNKLIRIINERIMKQPVRHAPEKKQDLTLYRRIRALEQREEELEETMASWTTQQEEQFERQPQTEQEKVQGWFSTISEEKKSQIKELYREQLSLMQNSISTSPGDTPPSSEEMLTILQENREGLNTRLQEILTEEEYERFLETLNKSRNPPGLPAFTP